MARGGIPLEKQIPIVKIIESIKRNQGFVSYCCKELNIDQTTFYKMAEKHPDLKQALEESRKVYDEKSLDQSERVLDLLVSKVETDPAHAFKSAIFRLNNKGKSRGYAHPEASSGEKLADAFTTFNKTMEKKENERRSKKSRKDSK